MNFTCIDPTNFICFSIAYAAMSPQAFGGFFWCCFSIAYAAMNTHTTFCYVSLCFSIAYAAMNA